MSELCTTVRVTGPMDADGCYPAEHVGYGRDGFNVGCNDPGYAPPSEWHWRPIKLGCVLALSENGNPAVVGHIYPASRHNGAVFFIKPLPLDTAP